MALPLSTRYAATEAKLVAELPRGAQWQYEPKWDGFRCLAFKDGEAIALRSKSGQPLERYFPEIVETLAQCKAKRFVLDGELVVPIGRTLSFDELLMRIHPAESRVARLAKEHPALLVAFDLLVDDDATSLVGQPFVERRGALERFFARNGAQDLRLRLSPTTNEIAEVERWFHAVGAGLDGVMAKRRDLPYQSGERTGMQKWKPLRTADCVVGGFRYASKGRVVGSLLLGLYDAQGTLDHVGFTSGIKAAERSVLTKKLEALIEPPGFTGRAPGGPSRWSSERSGEWEPLAPKLVAEVQYDHFSGERFRHGTRFLRWRPDKAPRQCTIAQVAQESASALALLGSPKSAARQNRR
jgi:ATP-dependent DNA ligase